MADRTTDINHQITDLITKSYDYKNKFKKRLVLTKVFSEFESKASKDFHYYIRDSNYRYKGMKSGNVLDSVLVRSKNKTNIYNDKVLTDNFYIAYNIDNERKNMKSLGNQKESKEIKALINNVIERTNSLLQKKKEKQHESNEVFEDKKTSRILKNMNKSTMQKQLKVAFSSHIIDAEYRLKKNKEILLTQFNKEESNLNDEIVKYKQVLHSIENDLLNQNEEAKKVLKPIHFPNGLKMLTYQKIEKEKKPEQTKRTGLKEDVNYKKILRFSKAALSTGHPPQTEEEIKASLVKLPLTYLDYSNTKDIVLTEASSTADLEQRIANKEKLINDCLKTKELPAISEYQGIVIII